MKIDLQKQYSDMIQKQADTILNYEKRLNSALEQI